jgi:hypothetical protein
MSKRCTQKKYMLTENKKPISLQMKILCIEVTRCYLLCSLLTIFISVHHQNFDNFILSILVFSPSSKLVIQEACKICSVLHGTPKQDWDWQQRECIRKEKDKMLCLLESGKTGGKLEVLSRYCFAPNMQIHFEIIESLYVGVLMEWLWC